MVTYIETTEKKTSATSNTTELNKNIVMSNFVYVLYDISVENLEIYTSEKSSFMLKTGTIQTVTPPKLLLNSMNNDGHFPAEGSVKSSEEYEYYLVQFNDTSKKTWKQDIPEIGEQLLDYVPGNAFVVRMNG